MISTRIKDCYRIDHELGKGAWARYKIGMILISSVMSPLEGWYWKEHIIEPHRKLYCIR